MSYKVQYLLNYLCEYRFFLPLLFILCLALLILRRPDALLMAQPWAEDGRIFLFEALQYSWESVFQLYAGYLHVIPRIITIFSLNTGLENAPFFMNLSAILISTAVGIFFATKQFRFIIRNDSLRVGCSLFIILAPGINEIWSNVTNVQWFLNIFMMFFTILLLFKYGTFHTKSTIHKVWYSIICSLIFLSSILTFIFFPIWLFILFRELFQNKKELKTLFYIIIPSSLLLFHIALVYFDSASNTILSIINFDNEFVTTSIKFLSTSIIMIFYYKVNVFFQHYGELIYLLPLGIIIFIIVNSLKRKSKLESFTFICIATVTFLSIVVRPNLILFFNQTMGGIRHDYFLMVFAFVLLVRQFDTTNSRFYKVVFLFLVIIISINVIGGFSLKPFPDVNYYESAKLYDPLGSNQCEIKTPPLPEWKFFIPCNIDETVSSKP